jgi:uncharacterized protein
MPTVAIIGATSDRGRWANKAIRAFARQGYTVYPVNPNEQEIEGLKCYPSIKEVPGSPDKISMYVRPAVGLKLLSDIAQKGCKELWLNPGTESDQVVEEAERLGLNVVQACSIIGVGVSPGSL